ncbi:MAG TPA: L-aspartate oxidase [Thermodesulfovibrionales bacterium]|nr:L-aspartate oxidase [Thermodesulfovibrionales bacterium]
MDEEFVDFLVVGSGVAGLRAAIELAKYGDVVIITKDTPTESSTEYAQGGIAVALSDEDEVGIHFEDTLRAGDGLCREGAVKVLVEEGLERITELISWGAEFDKEGTKLAFTREAAHSKNRVLHAQGDSTGRELERVLLTKVRTYPSVKKYPFAFTLGLNVRDGECTGISVLRDGKVVGLSAKATILATGGAGQLYERTTNPGVATGDGMAIACRAGAILEDMEFVQFHPTSLYVPGAPHFLLSEAMRGEGALLRNIHRRLFMERYHPLAELAPRDVVSRAILSEMVETGSSHVYLDLTHLKKSFLVKRFPRINATCRAYRIDITEDLIPVTPAAHYVMGGIKTDLYGATNIPRLYAAGEVACTGVHGANRLASNSLLEGLVFGARAGLAASQYSRSPRISASNKRPHAVRAAHCFPPVDLAEARAALRKLMWEKVGIIRCSESLLFARERLSRWMPFSDEISLVKQEQETKNMITVAHLITESALARKGSIGAHYRSDFPAKGRAWKRHIQWERGGAEEKAVSEQRLSRERMGERDSAGSLKGREG